MDSIEGIEITKLYMPDTNSFRYKAYIINKGNLESKNERAREQERARQQQKKAAIRFWDKIITEANERKATILVSSEVILELKVQSHTLERKENKAINKLISILEVEDTEVPKDIEGLLRQFSNYARKNFGSSLIQPGRSMDYLRASDAIIFVHAYLNDAILATANIKDFLLYPLFFGTEENVLYDILTGQYVQIPTAGRVLVEQDEDFKILLSKMRDLKY